MMQGSAGMQMRNKSRARISECEEETPPKDEARKRQSRGCGRARFFPSSYGTQGSGNERDDANMRPDWNSGTQRASILAREG